MNTQRTQRKILATILAALLIVATFSLVACANGSSNSQAPSTSTDTDSSKGQSGEPVTITVGAAQVPHAEILEFIKPKLAEQGITLEIYVPSDESSLNQQTDNGELDANYFQHEPYLDSVVAEKGYDLVSVAGIHVEPIGAYSDKYTAASQISDGDTVAIPYDGTNEYRALRILEQAGFITLKPDIDPVTTTKNDIASYNTQINIVELEAGLIVRTHSEYDVYITNTNRILEAGIDTGTSLFREGADSPYANIIVVKSEHANDPAITALIAALKTDDVKQFIEEHYHGAVIPAF